MKNLHRRLRYLSVALATCGGLALNGCSLSDQQLAGVWQSVIASGLNTIVSNVITAVFQTTTGA